MTDAPAPFPDHLGWNLHQAARLWEERYGAKMAEAGFAGFGGARARLLTTIPADGIGQAQLAMATGLTKQAVQQQLDALEAAGFAARITDPGDKRQKRVIVTGRGREVLGVSARIEQEIEAEAAAAFGPARVHRLKNLTQAFIGFCVGS